MATALSSVAWEASVLEPRNDRELEAILESAQGAGKGRYLVRLFSSPQQYGKYHYIGQFEANRE